jgi:hypothetical protein
MSGLYIAYDDDLTLLAANSNADRRVDAGNLRFLCVRTLYRLMLYGKINAFILDSSFNEC